MSKAYAIKENHPAFYAENNGHAIKRLADDLRKKAAELIDMADDLETAAALTVHYSLEAQGKSGGQVPAKKHNRLRCKNGDHDECLQAQLAFSNGAKEEA